MAGMSPTEPISKRIARQRGRSHKSLRSGRSAKAVDCRFHYTVEYSGELPALASVTATAPPWAECKKGSDRRPTVDYRTSIDAQCGSRQCFSAVNCGHLLRQRRSPKRRFVCCSPRRWSQACLMRSRDRPQYASQWSCSASSSGQQRRVRSLRHSPAVQGRHTARTE
jgi:hypothetical protein